VLDSAVLHHRYRRPANPPVVESLLRSLPAWFGIEAAIDGYVAAAARLTTYMARTADDTPVGVLLVTRRASTRRQGGGPAH